ncbi:MAG: hypothetical protein U9Q40_06825 [Campylobacterota bacterium]|nr:hypothetical protein [Campylobacterota bacterium]
MTRDKSQCNKPLNGLCNKTYLGFISTLLLFSSVNATLLENSLIVYNGNVGLVHESKKIKITKNDKSITYENVASSIETDSVNVKLPNSVKLYSQQYRYDKLTLTKLLNAHIGKDIQVRILKNAKEFKVINATLLSNNGNSSLVKTDKKKIISVNSKDIIFKTIPSELLTKPSLVWNIKASKTLNTEMEIDYLIKNITWSSDYILNLGKKSADLSGWITIDNRSGKKFSDTSLYVLAGEINRAKKPTYRRELMYTKAAADSTPVAQEAHEGYHFYTIPFKVNLANNEKTQIKFTDKKSLKFERKYSAKLQNPLYLRGEIKSDVSQYIKLKGLDIPLPKGLVRTYSKLRGTSVLLGETNIAHTPKETDIELRLGKNFDVKVTQTLLSRDDSQRYFMADVKYTLKNSSDKTKRVEVLVPFNKNKNSIVKSSQKYKFTKGNLVTFSVLVKANSSKSFKVHFETKK